MPPPMKRRRTEPTVVEEITFDPTARREFLTGFHKRKLQKAKQAREAAERRARVERVEERKRLREQRKAELERHVQEVNAILRPPSDPDEEEVKEGSEKNSEEEWSGILDSEPPSLNHETEYIDEEKYTTVTVEAMNVTREGLFKAEQRPNKDGGEERGETTTRLEGGQSEKQKRQWSRDRPKDTKKRKKRNFRYESKAERKEARTKEKAKNRKQARERRGDQR